MRRRWEPKRVRNYLSRSTLSPPPLVNFSHTPSPPTRETPTDPPPQKPPPPKKKKSVPALLPIPFPDFEWPNSSNRRSPIAIFFNITPCRSTLLIMSKYFRNISPLFHVVTFFGWVPQNRPPPRPNNWWPRDFWSIYKIDFKFLYKVYLKIYILYLKHIFIILNQNGGFSNSRNGRIYLHINRSI